ncbi:hypothetical protein, partial [Dyadobacter sp. CY312]|uniref:hypothetical protein n=1 Tax=Dyadobacter sp. CY312 TaxID=2907303 RepID=UPI001F3C2097
MLEKTIAFWSLSSVIKGSTMASFVAFFLFLGVKIANAQATCGDVTSTDITTTPATCPGNGSITAPTLATTTIYQLSGGGIAGEIQQNSPVFGSLEEGDYTLTLLCTGELAKSIPVTVADAHSPLGMSLTGIMACAGTGAINAVATGGFNNGGAGVNYQYAMWPESAGGANRVDGGLTYGASPSFGNALVEGKYFVRVKDNCGNIFTQSIILKPSKPVGKASLGTPTVTCVGGTFTYAYPNAKLVDPNGAEITDFSSPHYTYRVEKRSSSTSCETQPPAAVIIPNTDITTATTLSSMSIPGIEPGQPYRVVVTSPCGNEEVVSCFVASELNLEVKPSRLCAAGDSLRVTVNLYPSASYEMTYPITIEISGTGITPEVITVTNWSQLAAIQRNYSESAFPITITAT